MIISIFVIFTKLHVLPLANKIDISQHCDFFYNNFCILLYDEHFAFDASLCNRFDILLHILEIRENKAVKGKANLSQKAEDKLRKNLGYEYELYTFILQRIRKQIELHLI